jgi:hypothetical protein
MKDCQTFIKRIIKHYQGVLRLSDVTFKVQKEDSEYLACKYRYPYTDTIIYYGSDFERDYKKQERYDLNELERRVVHEMIHQLTDPLYAKGVSRWVNQSDIEDERERLTDRIATIVCSLTQKDV